MKSLIFLGLVLAIATIATVQVTHAATTAPAKVAHGDLSKCIPIMAKVMNESSPVGDNASGAQRDMKIAWQCIHANL